jgi:hypothetical protein
MARITAAALAAPNVVAFPNAAARKVNNNRYREQRHAAKDVRQDSPFPSRYLLPCQRKADRLAEELAGIEQTPALLIVSAILRTMDAEQVNRVVDQLTDKSAAERKPVAQALATIEVSRLNFAGQYDLLRAFDRMRTEARA